MGERYVITGVQLGMIKAFSKCDPDSIDEIIETIIEKQYIGHVNQNNSFSIEDIRNNIIKNLGE